MARHTGWALAAFMLVGSAVEAVPDHASAPQADQQRGQQKAEQKPDQHRGPWIWWKDDSARTELKLSAEQVAEIERIFQANMAKAKPLREEVNELEAALNQTMRANTAEISVVSQQVDKVESKRAELNKMRVLMLYRIHRVLSAEQNARFQAMVDRWESARKKAASPGGHRR
ncbi:MAG: Spy/CpxP family protein refolding chaperone [Vicinamibacterales bacterium]